MFNAIKISAALLISTVSMSQAATVINIETSAGVAQETQYAIRSDTSTRGTDLGGMRVTASYDDGSNETLIWEAYDPYTFGGTNGSDVDINMGWQGFQLTTTRLMTGLLFEADLGNAMFDMTSADGTADDTLTTGRGTPFSFYNDSDVLLDGTVTASYSGIVNIAGAAAVGDVYTDMFVDFSQLDAGGLLGNAFFESDLDSLAVIGDLSPVDVSAVPLPATLPLMLVALGGIGLMRRKKRS
jgi:hypothetical protein